MVVVSTGVSTGRSIVAVEEGFGWCISEARTVSPPSGEYSLDRSQPHLVQKFWPSEWGLAHLVQAFLSTRLGLCSIGLTKNIKYRTGATPSSRNWSKGISPSTRAAIPHTQGFLPLTRAARAVQNATKTVRAKRNISLASNPKIAGLRLAD